jgi:hypothetical protein
VPGFGENRDHPAVEVAPRRLAVQAEKDALGVFRAFVEVVNPHARAGFEIVDVVACEVITGQAEKALFRRAQNLGHGLVS